MSAWQEAALIVGMMAVTFGVRYPILALSGRIQMPAWLVEALRFVPVAVLSAIIIPMVMAPKQTLWLAVDNEYLVASVVAIIIAAKSRYLLLTIVAGMALFFVLRFLF